MTNQTRSEEFRKILNAWADFYKADTQKLIQFIRSQGYPDAKIAEILGITRQAVKEKYAR